MKANSLIKLIDEIFQPIQEEYDGGEPMLPSDIPRAKIRVLALIENEVRKGRLEEAKVIHDFPPHTLTGFKKAIKARIKTLSKESQDEA